MERDRLAEVVSLEFQEKLREWTGKLKMERNLFETKRATELRNLNMREKELQNEEYNLIFQMEKCNQAREFAD